MLRRGRNPVSKHLPIPVLNASSRRKKTLAMTGWSAVEFPRKIDTNDRTVRRWLSGDQPIPYAVWCVLCVEANLGQIWK